MQASRWLPFLAWPRPDAALLRGELAAGVSVALLMIPQAVAYAALAGMPLVTGLYAALLPALVAVLWGNSTRASVGPTALTALLVSASLTGLAPPGSAQWVALAVWLALLAGLAQFALGVLRAGWVLNLISVPVMTGFTQAAALLIMSAQAPALLGLAASRGAEGAGSAAAASGAATGAASGAASSTVSGAWGSAQALAAGARPDLIALGCGIAALAALLLARRLWPRLPMIFVLVALAAPAAWLSGYSARGQVVGALPTGLPAPYWPLGAAWPGLELLGTLLVPALVIALVSFLEAASAGRTEAQADGRRWDDNQDLIAQGLAKIAAGFSGSFATGVSFSRSAVALYSGARTGWSTVATVGCVLLALLLLMPALAHVPLAVLAAIVVAAVASLLKPSEFTRLWRIDRAEAGIALVTFAVTLLSAPRIQWGVLTGVVLGLALFLYHRLHPRIIEIGLHPDGSLRDRHLWKLPPLAPHLYALRMDAALDFASASALERDITEHLAAHPGLRQVVIFASALNRIDATGVQTFAALRSRLAAAGIELHISGMKLPVETALRRAGELPDTPLLRLYRTDAEALAALQTPADAAAQRT